MKRKIIFRGKTKRRHRWVYGALVQNGKEFGLISQDEDDANYGIAYYVDEDTVGQFTELYDSNGKPIYEGDIVERYDEYYVVEFNIKRRGYYPFACGDGCGCCEYETMSPEDIEVVGNIYDDEELVKEHNL